MLPSSVPNLLSLPARRLLKQAAVQLRDAHGNAVPLAGVRLKLRLKAAPSDGSGGEAPGLAVESGEADTETDERGRAFFGDVLVRAGMGRVVSEQGGRALFRGQDACWLRSLLNHRGSLPCRPLCGAPCALPRPCHRSPAARRAASSASCASAPRCPAPPAAAGAAAARPAARRGSCAGAARCCSQTTRRAPRRCGWVLINKASAGAQGLPTVGASWPYSPKDRLCPLAEPFAARL
jgi:hypothetical protein